MKQILKKLLLLFPIKIQIFFNFRARNGYFPNFKKPKSYNEKVQFRKLFDNNPLFVTCSDKYKVRGYVEAKVGKDYLIPLLYVGENISEKVLRNIEKNFVVKTTHDSGTVIIIKKNDEVDYKFVVDSITKSLGYDFGKLVHEPWYSKIEPKVIIEEMLQGENGSVPNDYKFHVFNRKNESPKVILGVDFDRFTKNQSRSFFDESGRQLDFEIDYPNLKKERPNIDNLDEMFRIAKALSEDFDYVRVDLYSVNNKIYFGELTFAMASGFAIFRTKEQDFEFGKFWE
ncbi:ATP-grasp fold amidoligase family protein [Shewanella inventionis]|uniref:Glycosyl transferase n=1 Tax=Shewanella inventionis TaxID=1738770 RepID=A0ABQ1JVE2_9GAMM|nr:ATP-grasp fold amidoligase family protein [Shewanella inventionis]MCL1159813.1 hypothetical protein [Shewanella inventionis]GGB75169.1 glycosyl transferase [Shewanella inventionis]